MIYVGSIYRCTTRKTAKRSGKRHDEKEGKGDTTRGETTRWRRRRTGGNDEDEERNARVQDGLIEQSQPRVRG